MQGDVDALKAALGGEDDDAVKSAFEKLSESQTKLGEAIYQAGQTTTEGDEPTEAASDEDVVDAEIVEDDEEPKK